MFFFEQSKLITPKDAAKILGVSRSSIYKYAEKRLIKHIKYPDKILFEIDEICRFKQKHTILNLF